eukprot:4716-Eustigmatos_ZCMA.PRE.1
MRRDKANTSWIRCAAAGRTLGTVSLILVWGGLGLSSAWAVVPNAWTSRFAQSLLASARCDSSVFRTTFCRVCAMMCM